MVIVSDAVAGEPFHRLGLSARVTRHFTFAAWLAFTFVLVVGSTDVQAQEGGDWQQTGLTEGVLQLFTPASGAFFALTQTGLWRSDDAGDTWRSVPSPSPPLSAVAVDPVDHTTLYAAGQAGLYKSSDDARTWQLVLAAGTKVPVVTCYHTGQNYLAAGCSSPQNGLQVPVWTIDRVVVSPVNRNLVYATFALTNDTVQATGVLGSADGGHTWKPLKVDAKDPSTPLDLPHYQFVYAPPGMGDTLFVGYWWLGSHFGDTIGSVELSTDRGTTWRTISSGGQRSKLAMVGGEAQSPMNFFMTLEDTGQVPVENRRILDFPEFWRSDDTGARWTPVSSFAEGDGSVPSAAFAQDRSDSERLYSGIGLPGAPGGVKMSPDGGATWLELGRQDIGQVNDIAVAIDDLFLFAATDQGVWRLRLSDANRAPS